MNEYSFLDGTMAMMTYDQIEKYDRENTAVLLPVGVIEEHGPHLPLATDILWSLAECRRIKAEIEKSGMNCLIAPPYYWGINHCTSGFAGSFTLRSETLKAVICDILGNLHDFGFDNVYIDNVHGDYFHIDPILSTCKEANERFGMNTKFLMAKESLEWHKLSGSEKYILVGNPEYPQEFFEGMIFGDIHAGSFETAAMEYFYPGLANLACAEALPDNPMNDSTFGEWAQGGEAARKVVPLGYAGSPAKHSRFADRVEPIMDILCKNVAEIIIADIRADKDNK